VDGQGKNGLFTTAGKPIDDVNFLAGQGCRVIAADLFQQGEFLEDGKSFTQTAVVENPRESAAYTHGYNHSAFAMRTQDILSLVAYANSQTKDNKDAKVYLVGTHGAGLWVAVASALAGDAIDKCVIINDGERFADITSYRDPDFIPGAVKYGDLPGLVAAAPSRVLWLGGEDPAPFKATQAAFENNGGSLTVSQDKGKLRPALQGLLGK
jgi:dienelactone hydrolase